MINMEAVSPMIIRPGDTQEVPDVGIFEWDGREFWVAGKVKCTHGQLYVMLAGMGLVFDIKSSHKG